MFTFTWVLVMHDITPQWMFLVLAKSCLVCLSFADDLKLLQCRNSVVSIRQNKRRQNFAWKFADFCSAKLKGFAVSASSLPIYGVRNWLCSCYISLSEWGAWCYTTLEPLLIITAHIIMQRRIYETVQCLSVCPSVSPSMSPQQQTCCCSLLLWSWRARDIDRFLQQQQANAGSAKLLADVGS